MNRPLRPSRLHPRQRRRMRLLDVESLETRELLSIVTVINNADSGAGSLRAAILSVNDPASGVTAIDFNIPGTGVQTIAPLSALPTITSPVTIDGYTQPGASPNTNGPGLGDNAVLLIELRGDGAGGNVSGLDISAGDSTVRGLAIGGFNQYGLVLDTNGGDVVAGDFIGTDATGATARPNLNAGGVLIGDVSGDTIGGTTAGARNVISANGGYGEVRISGGGATGNLVAGNFLGADAAGNLAPTSSNFRSSHGVLIDGAPGNTIGGTTPAARNVIVLQTIGVDIAGVAATANRVEGDFIGTDVTGTAALGNLLGVVDELSASGNVIGGTQPGAGNLISGNTVAGVALDNENSTTSATTGNLVEGNLIGPNVTGAAPLAGASQTSAVTGVYAARGASGNTIGGTAAGAGNIIAFNNGFGVSIIDSSETDDAILGNAIFSNSELGIALGGNVTTNTTGGPHVGPNDLQNYPVITSSSTSGGNTEIQGTFNSIPNTTFRLEFFANPAADPSGFGQGQTFLGASTVTTDANGNAVFDSTFPTPSGAGAFVTATATDPNGNTSEFSQDFQETAVNPLVVTTTADGGPGSLRAAITYSNANPGTNTITFDIPLAGIQSITPLSPLPTITSPVTIDGYTQPGASSNTNGPGLGDDAVLLIEIDGTVAGSGADGLTITAGASLVRGLVIDGFSTGAAVRLSGAGADQVTGDFLGIDLGGDGVTFADPVAKANNVGVQVESALNTIGGTTPADRDVVSGNSLVNVSLTSAGATGNLVEGVFVGTNPAGIAAYAATGDGVEINNGAAANTVGGASTAAGDVISGNGASGVHMAGAGTTNNVVEGDFIGADVTGRAALANMSQGVLIEAGASNNTIGGTAAGDGNVISGNGQFGVQVTGAGTSNNTLQGNLIGVDATGEAALGNGQDGVNIVFNATGTLIGGTTAGAGNVISGNGLIGYGSGIGIGYGTSNDTVEGNFIGTDKTGAVAIGNHSDGIFETGGNDLIGGVTPAARNIISGNAGDGVQIAAVSNVAVEGNFIGADLSGTKNLGNGGQGVWISNNASNNTVGGTASGMGNTIAFNAKNGVSIETGNDTGNAILGNAILGNAGLGIDLGNDGVTPNSPGAHHSGPNDLQNYPVITSATPSGGNTEIQGAFNSAPNTTFRIEFFANPAADRSGFGQGQTFLGASTLTTDANGSASFDSTFPTPSGAGGFVTATATDPNGNTSEFSQDVQESAAPIADLAVTGAAAPAPATVGLNLTYTLRIVDNGPNPAAQVSLSDVLPPGVTFVSASASQGGVFQDGGVVTASLGYLGDGHAVTITIIVTPTAAGTITDIAQVRSAAADPVPANNHTSLSTTVVAPLIADLSVTGIPTPAAATVGGDLTYTFTVANNGPNTATGVTLSDALPAGLSFVSVQSSLGTAAFSGGVVTDVIPTLAAGATAQVTLLTIPTVAGSITDTAIVGADQTDPNMANNRATVIVNATLAAPINVFSSLVQVSPGQYDVLVTWGLPNSSVNGLTFNVYRYSDSGGAVKVSGLAGGSSHSFLDAGVVAGATYVYQVTAVDDGVESARSLATRITVALNYSPPIGFFSGRMHRRSVVGAAKRRPGSHNLMAAGERSRTRPRRILAPVTDRASARLGWFLGEPFSSQHGSTDGGGPSADRVG